MVAAVRPEGVAGRAGPSGTSISRRSEGGLAKGVVASRPRTMGWSTLDLGRGGLGNLSLVT